MELIGGLFYRVSRNPSHQLRGILQYQYCCVFFTTISRVDKTLFVCGLTYKRLVEKLDAKLILSTYIRLVFGIKD